MTGRRPVFWKPRYPTRSMRERAWANADLARERALRGVPPTGRLLSRLRQLFRYRP
jgi:hypothetical protein